MEGRGGVYSGPTERQRRRWAGDGGGGETQDRGGGAPATKPEPWVMRQQVPTAPHCQTPLASSPGLGATGVGRWGDRRRCDSRGEPEVKQTEEAPEEEEITQQCLN